MGRISLRVGRAALETPINEDTQAMTHTWSSEQQAIFTWFKEPSAQRNLVVRARAGTGKTTTILEAINGAPEKRILLAAFNKTIAEELQSRMRNPAAESKTLHALGFSYLRAARPKVKVDNKDRKWTLAKAVCPRSTPYNVLRLVADLHTKGREIAPRLIEQDPSTATDALAEIALEAELTLREEDAERYSDYQVAEWALAAMHLAKDQTDSIDFADMIFLPLVHGWVTPRYDLVVVDEAQDMSQPQLELAQRACRVSGRIAVVGDDRQAIYGWRGADSNSLDRLKKALNAVELGLKTTYRCPQLVVERAQQIVPDFVAAPSAPMGIVRSCLDARDTLLLEAKPGDFVLSRTNAPLVPLCLALLKQGKVARIRGRDLSAGLRKLCEQLERAGAKDIGQLRAALAEHFDRTAMTLNRRLERGELRQDVVEEMIERVRDNVDVIVALSDELVSLAELYARFETLFTGDDLSTACSRRCIAPRVSRPTVCGCSRPRSRPSAAVRTRATVGAAAPRKPTSATSRSHAASTSWCGCKGISSEVRPKAARLVVATGRERGCLRWRAHDCGWCDRGGCRVRGARRRPRAAQG